MGKRDPSFEIKFLQIVGFGQWTKILSTYTKTMTSEGANVTKREQSDKELEKPRDTKAWKSFLYQAQGACFRPQRDLLTLQTKET